MRRFQAILQAIAHRDGGLLPAVCVVVALVALLAGGCGTAAFGEGVAGKAIKPLDKAVVSGSVIGLRVSEEDIAGAVRKFQRSYADRVSMYGFRGDNDLLEATLQVSRFNDATKLKSSRFRAGLVTQIGEANPQVLRVDDVDIQVTRAHGQRLYLWVSGRYVLVLSVRDDFKRPRDLLRNLASVKP
jgi:hypothetical protein